MAGHENNLKNDTEEDEVTPANEQQPPSSISKEAALLNKQLCTELGIDENAIDWPGIKESIEKLRYYPCTGCSYSFSLHKLLETVNKIWNKVKNCDCDLLPTIDTTTQDTNTKVDYLIASCCDGGGGDISCQELIEKIDSVYDVVTDTNTKVDHILESCCDSTSLSSELLESVYEVVIENNSIVEDISDRLPCKVCDACITQADIVAAGGIYTISSGGTYCVAENLTHVGGSSPVININSNDVTLDLHGHTITGDTGLLKTSIYAGSVAGVTIKNGAVTGGEHGIVIDGTTDWTIKDIRAHACADRGILVASPTERGIIDHVTADNNGNTGIFIGDEGTPGDIEKVDIIDSFARQNGSGDIPDRGGFVVYASADSEVTFRNCAAHNNEPSGFGIISCGSCVLKDCIALRNDNNGFEIGGGTIDTPAIIQGCIALHNGDRGFYVTNNGEGTVIRECTSGFSAETTMYEYHLEINKTTLLNNIAMSIENGGFICGAATGTPGTLTAIFKNCIANATSGATFGFTCTPSTSRQSLVIDGCVSSGYANGFFGLGYSIVRSSTASNFSIGGFILGDGTCTIRDCTADTAREPGGTLRAFYLPASDAYSIGIIENCTAYYTGSTPSGEGFFHQSSSYSSTFRNNIAVGWETGYSDPSGKCLFLSNLAQDNTTGFSGGINSELFANLAVGNTTVNYTGIDTSNPTGVPGFGGYFIAHRDNTSVGGGTNRLVPWSDLTGYWTNMADPN